MARTPDDPTKAQAWLWGTPPDLEMELYIPRGAKGEPGGFTPGTALLNANLDEIVTDGIYRQNGPQYATLLNNYPVAGVLGILLVHQESTSTWMRQTFYPNGYAGQGRVFYQRVRSGSTTWQPWRAYPSHRVDQTAGRAIYEWDDLNGREQLVYGDTGQRQITAAAGTTSVDSGIFLRRIGQAVYLRIIDTTFTPSASTTPVLTLPAGFRVNLYFQPLMAFSNGQYNAPLHHLRICPNYDATTPNGMLVMSHARQALTVNTRLNGEFSWTSYENWPATLPGVAAGAIPNL